MPPLARQRGRNILQVSYFIYLSDFAKKKNMPARFLNELATLNPVGKLGSEVGGGGWGRERHHDEAGTWPGH